MQVTHQYHRQGQPPINSDALVNGSHRFTVLGAFGAGLIAVVPTTNVLPKNEVVVFTGDRQAPQKLNLTPKIGKQIKKRLDSRIADLKEFAEEDNITLSEGSDSLLKEFVTENATKVPAVVYTDGGYFRAIWRNSKNEQAALIFRSKDEVQFVFFALKHGNFSRATGVAAFDALPSLLRAHSVAHLL